MGQREFLTGLAWVAALRSCGLNGETAAQPLATAAQPKRSCFFIRSGRISSREPHGIEKYKDELNRQSPWPLNIQDQSLVTAIDWRR